jgi:hypothetical protein
MPDFWILTLSGARPGQGQREEVGNFQMSLLGSPSISVQAAETNPESR